MGNKVQRDSRHRKIGRDGDGLCKGTREQVEKDRRKTVFKKSRKPIFYFTKKSQKNQHSPLDSANNESIMELS